MPLAYGVAGRLFVQALAEKAATGVVRLGPDFEPGLDFLVRVAGRQFFGEGIQSAQHIEALAAGRGFDEYPGKAPDNAQERRQYKMRRIDEENSALTGDGLLQLGHQFLFKEFLLDLRVRFGGDGSHLPWFHANLFEEFSNLGRFALNAGQGFDLLCCVGDSCWRILQKKSFKVL